MGQYHRLSLEQRRELARRHRRGERAEALAAAYGVSVHRIVAAQTAETARARDPTVSVSFRAPRSEVAAFKALAAETGLGRRGSAMRALVRMASGLLTVPPTHLEAAQHAAIALSRLGVNLNQLARRANMGRIAITEADRALLRALGREVHALATSCDGHATRRWTGRRTLGPRWRATGPWRATAGTRGRRSEAWEWRWQDICEARTSLRRAPRRPPAPRADRPPNPSRRRPVGAVEVGPQPRRRAHPLLARTRRGTVACNATQP